MNQKNIVWLMAFGGLLFSCTPEFKNQPQLPQPGHNRSVVETKTKNADLNRLIDSLQLDRNRIHAEIKKTAYTLQVFYDTLLLRTYPVVFGFNAIDDKLKQGDGCTPEGVFHIRARYPHAEWSRFIWIDYPTKDSWAKHQAAKRKGLIPKNASIGGEVGIHGVPKGYDWMIAERENWTLGCISLTTAHINELYKALGPKSYILITQ